ncbi:hypothetical protein BDV25DRAFT_168579 [Aspergillus avenaceus]|uniref:Translation initiation factor eIF-2B subunit family protein n=1 Tax=Aspergillus avenaceus TaxID=36643 RepID=A0A5N6TPC3_ASPAV|nr:hypothetical protein BDV25DRAFT_168579 [Aspergillus avenaceus]
MAILSELDTNIPSSWQKTALLKDDLRQKLPPCRVALCFIFQSHNVDRDQSKSQKPNSAQVRENDRTQLPCRPLAPVLGIIKDNTVGPLDAAWKAIEEQSAIPLASLSVYRYGKSFLSDAPSLGRRCIFYPFAFRLKTRADVGVEGERSRLNHRSYNLDARHSVSFGRVEDHVLEEGFRKIWFEVDLGPIPGRILASGLKQLQRDHESGARKLAAISLNILKAVLAHLDDPITQGGPWWRKARMAAWHLWKNGRQSMDAAILSFLLMTLTELEASLSVINSEDTCRSLHLSDVFDNIQKTIRSYKTRISNNFGSYVISKINASNQKPTKLKIMTLSASCTIRECIVQIVRMSGVQSIEICVLESRPLFEGVSLASSLLECFENEPSFPKVHVSICTDASVALAAKETDFLLLAADRIAADGSVSNKTGSLPAALCVRHMSPSAEIIVVSEIDKVAMQSCDTEAHTMENNESAEIVDAWQQSESIKGLNIVEHQLQRKHRQITVDVPNVYFEWVPPTLIDAYICEDGITSPTNFQKRSQWIKEQCERHFDNSL